MSDGAWIFLSHSHKDFDRVRALRNELEGEGHHPLLFFLKCLDDDSEIDGLIRREIEARSWFIFCDSPDSRSSRWVAEERKIIGALPTHTSATVDLNDSLSAQLSSISKLTKRASVFLSYAGADRQSARQIEDALRADDFGVFSVRQLAAGVSWRTEIESALDYAVERGAVLVILSRSSVSSQYQKHELARALEHADPDARRRNIVPVFLDPPSLALESAPVEIRDVVGRIQGFDFSTGTFEDNMVLLKRWLRSFEWRS